MEFHSLILIFLSLLSFCKGQYQVRPKDAIRWCAVGDFEYKKCLRFSTAVKASGRFDMMLQCVKTWSKDECMEKIDSFEADLVVLDPGEVFLGGRYHSLIPIMTEAYGPGAEPYYYSVAVVNRTSPIVSAYDLQDKKVCFPGVGQMAGWVYPISKLLNSHIMPITDCNNHLKSAANFFGPSCAPNALIDKNNPTGDNPLRLCNRCGTDHETKCLDSDTFAGFGGAFLCMRGNRGDVAFMKHTTPQLMAKNPGLRVNLNDYELVCPTGYRRASLSQFGTCNWGRVPAHAVVTSSEMPKETIWKFQAFLKMAVNSFGTTGLGPPSDRPPIGPRPQYPGYPTQSPYREFNLFESGGDLYENHYNLLFSDDATRLESIDETKQTFKDYLGNLENIILDLRQCPVESVKFCIVSDIEMRKCIQMRTAMRAQLLKPELVCFRGHSQRDCMVALATGSADLTMLDAGDVYTAGKEFKLIPILAEKYNLDGPYYYAVAVAKIEDPDTDLLFVRGKYSCHTAVGSGAGWIMPINFLLKNDRLRNHGCDGAHAAAEFFQKSCAPGALSNEYNQGWKQDSLCDLCHGTSGRVCQRDHTEDFYGFTGAYRCLVEGGGHMAFVKHTTVYEIANGNNIMWWARNLLSDDYELLCRDGSRKPINEFESCNLGKVPGNAMVARADNETVIDYYVNLFLYAQQYYGSKNNDEMFKFQMFRSEFPYNDIIFQDAAQQLVTIPPEQQNYIDYLGYDFVHAKIAVDCTAGTAIARISLTTLAITCVLMFLVHLR